MVVRLQLQRTVQIANKRLNVLYAILNIAAIVLCVMVFINGMQYTIKISVAPNLTVIPLDKSIELLGVNFSYPHLCGAPQWEKVNQDYDRGVYSSYAYWLRACGNFCNLEATESYLRRRQEVYGALDKFWRREVLRDCYDIGELVSIENSAELAIITRKRVAYFGTDIKFPPFFRDPTPELHDEHRQPGDEMPPNSSIMLEGFYPVAMETLLEFSYTCELQSPATSHGIWGLNSKIRTSYTNKHSVTVVVDHNHNIYRVIQPGDSIVHTLSDVVFLAQAKSIPSMSKDNSGYRERFFEYTGVSNIGNDWVYRELPPEVYTRGASISGTVNCYNTDQDLEQKIRARGANMWADVHASFAQPVCILEFTVMADELVQYNAKREDATTEWIFSNKVHFVSNRGDSYHRAWDVSSCFVNLAAILVLVSVPNVVLRFITLNLCGQLSAVYKRTVVQPFDIRSQCGSVAAKLMAQSIAFVDLADQKGLEGKRGISMQRMLERLKTTLRHRQSLDEAEVHNLSKFCFDEVANGRRDGFLGIGLDDIGALRHTGHWAKHSTKKDVIDIDSFSIAMSKNDGLDFQSIVDLFDKDRRRNLAERFFTPNDITKILRNHKLITKSQEQASDGEQPVTRAQSTMSIEDSKKLFDDKFTRLYDMMTQGGGFESELLAVQTRQVKMESEIKWLYSQIDKIKSNAPDSDSRAPLVQQIATAKGSDEIEELRQEMHALVESLKRSMPSQLEDRLERVVALEDKLEHVTPLIVRVAVLEDKLQHVRGDSSLYDVPRQGAVAAQIGSPMTDKSAFSVDAASTDHVTQLTQRVETLETWCSEQLALFEQQCNARFRVLETLIRTAEASSAQPTAFEPRQNSRQRCVEDWPSLSCVQREPSKHQPIVTKV